jgi:hypothetical protein
VRVGRADAVMVIDSALVPLLDEMFYELSEERLEVGLVPGNNPEKVDNGRMIRVAISVNPDWYQELCAMYPGSRTKHRPPHRKDTKIKRQYIMIVLERMIRNRRSNSKYAEYLLDYAKDRKGSLDSYQEEEHVPEPWNNQF